MKHRRVVVCDKITMEIIEELPMMKDAAEIYGFKMKAIHKACQKRQVLKGRYVFRYAEDYDKYESFEGRRNRPVKMFLDGKAVMFYSIEEAAKNLNYSKSHIEHALCDGREVGGNHICYAR